jgi:anion-transporting  ArsA/GET3 family ATPase
LSSLVTPATLLDRRLLFVTGKGGAGKSTVTAALALLAVRAGKRVLVCEVNAPQDRIAPLLGAVAPSDPARHPSGPAQAPTVRPGLRAVNVRPRDAMREYGLMVLKFRAVYEAVFDNRLVRYFLRAVPSLAELVMLGKILHEVRVTERDGRPRWDLVLVDAPASGHAVQLLRVPAALLDTVPPGPLRRDAQWMRELLVDPRRTAVALVTLPEELPVTEALELDAQLRDVLGMARAALFVNAMPRSRFTEGEAERLSPLAGAAPPLGPAALAAVTEARRAAEAARHLRRLRETLDLPTTVLPLLPASPWGPAEVEALAGAVAAGGAGATGT